MDNFNNCVTNEQMYYMLAQQAMMYANRNNQQQPQQPQTSAFQLPGTTPVAPLIPPPQIPPVLLESKTTQQEKTEKIPPPVTNSKPQVIVHTFLGAREIELLIREFNPLKTKDLYAAEWIRELELLGLLHQWNSYQLLLYASMRLGGVAKTWYLYSLEHISDWDDFKLELLSNFPQSIDESTVSEKLEENSRRNHQSLEEYFYSTVKLGKSIKLNDDEIKEYLVKGLDHTRHRIILSALGPCSLGEFLQHMQRLEGEKDEQSSEDHDHSTSHKSRIPGSRRDRQEQGKSEREKGEVKDNYQKKKDIEKPRVCVHCHKDHSSLHCPENRRSRSPRPRRRFSPPLHRDDFRKNSPDRRRSSPPSRGVKRPEPPVKRLEPEVKEEKKCFVCGDSDHFAAKCPHSFINKKKKSDTPSAKPVNSPKHQEKTTFCPRCRVHGHKLKECLIMMRTLKEDLKQTPQVKQEPSDPLTQYEREHALEIDMNDLDYEADEA